jgi:hypothetical protein
MRGGFGQGIQKIAYESPNARLIRTEHTGNPLRESEYEAYSDRTNRKFPQRVRIPGLFGQGMQKIPSESPNARLIRTEPTGNSLKESEYEAYSDWTYRNLPHK